MLTNQTMHHKPAFTTRVKGYTTPYMPTNETRRPALVRKFKHSDHIPVSTAAIKETAAYTATGADDFYDRLQRLWDRLLVFQDMGLIQNEADKFNYAYQLAEAEIQERCQENARLRQQLAALPGAGQ